MDRFELSKNKNDEWQLKAMGADRAKKTFDGINKEDAIRQAADILKRRPEPSSLVIRKENHQFQSERTYPKSADPRKSKG